MSSPWHTFGCCRRLRRASEAHMKQNACDDEEAEDDDLDKETGDNDLFAEVVEFQSASRLNASSACLESEGENIAGDEDFCDPFDRDERKMFSVDGANEACEDHVDGCSKKSRRDQDENCLYDETADAFFVKMRPDPASVADGLNLRQWLLGG